LKEKIIELDLFLTLLGLGRFWWGIVHVDIYPGTKDPEKESRDNGGMEPWGKETLIGGGRR